MAFFRLAQWHKDRLMYIERLAQGYRLTRHCESAWTFTDTLQAYQAIFSLPNKLKLHTFVCDASGHDVKTRNTMPRIKPAKPIKPKKVSPLVPVGYRAPLRPNDGIPQYVPSDYSAELNQWRKRFRQRTPFNTIAREIRDICGKRWEYVLYQFSLMVSLQDLCALGYVVEYDEGEIKGKPDASSTGHSGAQDWSNVLKRILLRRIIKRLLDGIPDYKPTLRSASVVAGRTIGREYDIDLVHSVIALHKKA